MKNKKMKAVIIMGSKNDLTFCKEIEKYLKSFDIKTVLRIASAHKTPHKVLEIIEEFKNDENLLFVTVAGRSNALSGMVDANTPQPVIACPFLNSKYGLVDIFSTLRMPGGVAPLTILDPENVALACAKILGIKNKEIREKVREYQQNKKKEIEKAEKEIQ